MAKLTTLSLGKGFSSRAACNTAICPGIVTKKKGFLVPASIPIPGTSNQEIWTPDASSLQWDNTLNMPVSAAINPTAKVILDEKPSSKNKLTTEEHFKSVKNSGFTTRVVFFKEKGSRFYVYIGVFELDLTNTSYCKWVRI